MTHTEGSAAIENPIWPDISNMITDHDVGEMKLQGLDLRDYDQVSAMAHKIYYYLGYKIMPLGAPWSDSQIETYNNWLKAGCPRDEEHQAELRASREESIESSGNRVRKDINGLDDNEKKLLKKAFKGLMDRDPKNASEHDPDKLCYFSLAGKHWYPVPTFCQHHIYNYLSWHRFQMLDFENALRSVPGCEEVTLPYWNIETGEFPELISEDPFKSYTFPIGVYPDFYSPPIDVGKKGTTTERNDELRRSATINRCIKNAMTAPKWAEYNGITNYRYDTTEHIIRAHDNGHVGIGRTMANQDIAAFDPVFWFFHANWDRLWWKWQASRNATELDGFKNTLEASDNRRWLTDPQMSISDPFEQGNSTSVDLTSLGVAYGDPLPVPAALEAMEAMEPPITKGPSWRDKNEGRSEANVFSISRENLSRVSLRVKGINRIKIPGSFWVVLSLGGEEVGRDAFFQSTFSGDCENCVSQSKIDFDFVFDSAQLVDEHGESKEIKVDIINALTDRIVDFADVDNPTINIRMLH